MIAKNRYAFNYLSTKQNLPFCYRQNITKGNNYYGKNLSNFSISSGISSCMVPMLQRGKPYGMHSHAGAWEREENLNFTRSTVLRLKLVAEKSKRR